MSADSLSFMALLKSSRDLISVLGALLIFISWLATSAFGERLKAARAAYDAAAANRQMYNRLITLHDLDAKRTMLDIAEKYERMAERAPVRGR